MSDQFEVKGQFIDILQRKIYPAEIKISNGIIQSISPITQAPEQYILPGFIDAHIHIESSMLCPTAFSRAATIFGTVATVSDPHEIANVCGMEGVHFMINNAKKAALKFHFGAPSCVPATSFETAGAVLDADAIASLMQNPDIYYLAEMMNFPGVLFDDEMVLKKLAIAKASGKPIDGHAPGLRGADAAKYIQAGISTDHECTTFEEAEEKIQLGMKILIREGSAAKNFETLVPLFKSYPQQLMFCSDDKHPDELLHGHINQLVIKAVQLGYNIFDILYAACIAPIQHYKLPVGQLQINDAADFIIVKDLINFEVLQTYINGKCVAENGQSLEQFETPDAINQFNITTFEKSTLQFKKDTISNSVSVNIIEAIDGQLITLSGEATLSVENGIVLCDPEVDILKIVVVNRYHKAPAAIGFIKNFGIKNGAIASSVAHDSHNIVAVGDDDDYLHQAIENIIKHKGGISVASALENICMPLPIAGLMTNAEVLDAAQGYEKLDKAAKTLGATLKAPFMTLSFMALPVIPSLKMTDKGLFNVDSFNFTSIITSK